jgi:hypothetical protein
MDTPCRTGLPHACIVLPLSWLALVLTFLAPSACLDDGRRTNATRSRQRARVTKSDKEWQSQDSDSRRVRTLTATMVVWKGGHGLRKVSFRPAMSYPSSPCGQATLEMVLQPFEGWPTRKAGGPWPSSTPPWTPHGVHFVSQKKSTLWTCTIRLKEIKLEKYWKSF